MNDKDNNRTTLPDTETAVVDDATAEDANAIPDVVSHATENINPAVVGGTGNNDAPEQEPAAGAADDATPAAQDPQAQELGDQQTGDGGGFDPNDPRVANEMCIALGLSKSKAHKIMEYAEQCLKESPVRLTDLMTRDGAKQIVSNALTAINNGLQHEYHVQVALAKNAGIKMTQRPPAKLEELPAYVAAMIMISTNDVKVLRTGENSHMIVSRHYYRNSDNSDNSDNSTTKDTWRLAGGWNISHPENPVSPVMLMYAMMCPTARPSDVKTFWSHLMAGPVIASAKADKDLVFFRNGIWDYSSRTFTAYGSPKYMEEYADKAVLAVIPVYHPLGPGALLGPQQGVELPQIAKDTVGTYPAGCKILAEDNQFGHLPDLVLHNDEDGTDWRPFDLITASFDMSSEMGKASSIIIQQSMQCMIRNINPFPHLYHIWINRGGEGGNGKSTLFAAYRRLVELPEDAMDRYADITETDLPNNSGAVISARINELGNNYTLGENILTAKIIAGEELDNQNTYVKKCALIKDLSRVQEITVRDIYEAPLRVTYTGFLLQESNDFPRFADKTDSMVSHLVGIPFDKPFGAKRPYIKTDYVLREEVAEWLAYYLTVEMAAVKVYDDWSIRTLKSISREIMIESSPALQFLEEAVKGLRMEFMPTEVLFDLFLRWATKNNISSRSVIDMGTFVKAMEQFAVHNEYGIEVLKPYSKRNSDPDAAKRKRTAIDDLYRDHPLLMEYGGVIVNGKTSPYRNRYAGCTVEAITDPWKYNGRLEETIFMDRTGKRGKLWNNGGLLRVGKSWSEVVVDDDGSSTDDSTSTDDNTSTNDDAGTND